MSIEISDISFNSVLESDFDFVITASGFERRASYQVLQLKGQLTRKLAIGFNNEKDDPNRIENDKVFSKLGFDLEIESEENPEISIIGRLFEEAIAKSKGKECCKIYVDYSSMSRNWYAQILLSARKLAEYTKVELYFGYSTAKFSLVEKEEKLNQIVEPLFGFCKLSIPYKPTALVICLGNEFSRVYGLREFFDSTTYLIYSDPKFGNSFSIEVEHVNREIIESAPPENVLKFPLEDVIYTYKLIESLCDALSKKFRVIIAPCGPKVFTLLSFIYSLKKDSDIEVWRISPGKDLQKIDREPEGKVILLKVSMTE